MKTRTCAICGQDKPLDEATYRWRVQDNKGYFTQECRDCIKIEKSKQYERRNERRKQGLERVEKAGVDIFVRQTHQGGSNIPHTAELVERVFQYFGGVGGFSAVLVKQYWDSPAGGSARSRLLETMARLVTKNVESGGAKKPLQLWSEDELETELGQRMAEAVKAYKGITIDAEEAPKRIAAPPKSIAAKSAAPRGDNTIPKRLLERTPKRNSRQKSGVAAPVQAEPESGSVPPDEGI